MTSKPKAIGKKARKVKPRIHSTSRFPKNCCDCKCATTGRNKRCRPCACRYSKLGEKNPQWRGNNVGYEALHEWIKRRIPRPKCCVHCGQQKALDLANISGEYKRDIDDWEYLCRLCHMKSDGRHDQLIKRNKMVTNPPCSFCGSPYKTHVGEGTSFWFCQCLSEENARLKEEYAILWKKYEEMFTG